MSFFLGIDVKDYQQMYYILRSVDGNVLGSGLAAENCVFAWMLEPGGMER